MRKVNQKEIEQLYDFTRQHYVEYFDLQTELVDHLATGIEKNWQENPEMDFEKNLQQEFKKFGVFGFMKVIESHQKAMNKRYWKIIWREVKNELAKPKVLFLNILLFLIPYSLFFSPLGFNILKGIILALVIAAIAYTFRENKKQEQKKKSQNIYLLEVMISQAQSNALLFNLSLQVVLFAGNSTIYQTNWWLALLVALAIYLPFLIFYMTTKVLPAKKEEILKEVHPEREWV